MAHTAGFAVRTHAAWRGKKVPNKPGRVRIAWAALRSATASHASAALRDRPRARPAGRLTRSRRDRASPFFFGSPGQCLAIAFTPHASLHSKRAAGAAGGAPTVFWFARPALGVCAEATRVRRDSKHAAGAAGAPTFFFLLRQTRALRLLETFHVTGHAPITRTPRHPFLPRPIPFPPHSMLRPRSQATSSPSMFTQL